MFSGFWRGVVAAFVVASAAACGADGRYVVIGSARAPSTSGIVEVDELDGGSMFVTIHMEHLHPPDRLGEGLRNYVVWFEGDASTLRMGELRYDPEARTGDLAETSPMSRFTVKITAEGAKPGSKPSNFVIATQKIALD
jgi:hypothetical protein